MSVYTIAIEFARLVDEHGFDSRFCIHSKMTPGCPGCADRFLHHHGIILTSWSPERFAAVNFTTVGA